MLEPVARRLREVTVRPTVGPSERGRWDALMDVHHYLPFRGLVGRSVRHVAVLGEHWGARAVCLRRYRGILLALGDVRRWVPPGERAIRAGGLVS